MHLKADVTKGTSEVHCPRCGLGLSLGTTVCPNDGTALAPECEIGSKFAGKYVLTALIGKGGMSAVYKGTDALLGRTVAIKLLHQYLAQDSVSTKRFHQEARTISQLNHPGIVRVYEFGVLDHGQPYIVMDYVEGMSLWRAIKQHGVARAEDAISIFKQITEALVHAHSHGVLHRDLKPSNVMLAATESGDQLHATLVDFGIAKVIAEDEAGHLTTTGEVIGSPAYMSPEQARGLPLDARSDLYSLGCLMYEALSGKPVVWGENALDVLFNKLNKDPVPLAEAAEPVNKIPQALDDIVTKLIQPEPDDRYQSASELLEDLNAIDAAAMSVTATKRPPKRKQTTRGSKMWTAFVAGAIVAGGICSAAVCNFMQKHQAPPPPPPKAAVATPAPAVVHHEQSPTDESLRQSWQRMFNEQKLYLNKTQVTDAGLKYIGQMTQLNDLNLNSTVVRDLTPLSSLRHLYQLDVGNTRIDNESLKALVNMPLHNVILQNNGITDAGIATISQIKTIDRLDVGGTQITDKAIGSLATMPNLHVWILENTGVGDEFVKAMPTKQPEWVSFSNTQLTNKGLRSLTSRLPNLKGITFGGTAPDAESVDIIASVPKLQQVYLNNACANDGALKKLSKLKNLETLGMDAGTITGSGIAELKRAKDLHFLQLNYDHIDDAASKSLSALHQLQSLALINNPLTDACLPNIAKLENLQQLDLSQTQITSDGLKALQPLKKLQSIKLYKINMSAADIKQFQSDHPGCMIER